MNNPLTYIRTKKVFSPTTKFRYASGLGDIIASILHSKLIGPITYMFTGQLKPCAACNSRIVILNQLFPINIWKYFFTDLEEMHEDIKKQYQKIGMDYIYMGSTKEDVVSIEQTIPEPRFLEDHPALQKEGYYLVDKKSSFNEDQSILTDTFIYKKI